jgi:O-antigen/teichoic acid export membrane protein
VTFALSALLSVASSVANSRIYGVKVIGAYALAVGAVAIVRLMSNAKERPALARKIVLLEPRSPELSGLFYAMFAFSIVLTCVVAAIVVGVIELLLSGPVSEPSLFLPLTANIAGYALFGNACENIEFVPAVFRAGRLLFWVRVTDGLVFILIAVPLGLAYGTIWALIVASVGSQVFGLAHRLFRARRFMRFGTSRTQLAEGFRTLPGVIRFGLKIVPGALADGAANELGTWLVASFSSLRAVGAYGRAWLTIKQFTVVQTSQEMLFPTLVERRAHGDGEGHARAYVDSVRYAAIGLLLVAAAAGGVAHGIMRVFGPGFDRGTSALQVLLLVPALFMISQTMRVALVADDRPWTATLAGILRLIVTFAAGAFLAWRFGGLGAAIGLVLGFIADLAFCSRMFLPHLDTPFLELWPLRQLLVIPVAFPIAFAGALFTGQSLFWPLGMFAGFAVGCIAYAAVMLLGGGLNERDRQRYREIRQKITKRRSAPSGPVTATTRRYSEPIHSAEQLLEPLFMRARRAASFPGASAVDLEAASHNGNSGLHPDDLHGSALEPRAGSR